MQDKKGCRTKIQAGDGQLEQLVERGRLLHDQAVYDGFAWIGSTVLCSTRRYFGNNRLSEGKQTSSEKQFINHISEIPA